MEPDRIQGFERIPPGCLLAIAGFLIGFVVGAIVGVTTTSPNEILRDFVVFVFAIIGAELGVAAALLGGSRWWLFRRFVRRSKHDDPGQAGHGRKGD